MFLGPNSLSQFKDENTKAIHRFLVRESFTQKLLNDKVMHILTPLVIQTEDGVKSCSDTCFPCGENVIDWENLSVEKEWLLGI